MANVTVSGKALAVNPLKVSQPVGASLAFLGLSRCMPLEHGARGCTSFNKLFFMRHFREPIALQTTAMDHVATILGADANLIEALATVARKNRPEVVGLVTTGLAETQGADITGTLRAFRARYPEYASMAIIPVNSTDTLGCLESGFALAVEAIIRQLVPEARRAGRRTRQVTVLAAAMLTPADLDAIRAWIEAFGLTPLFIPDLGDSLDGHLTDEGYSALTYGGTPAADIAHAGESVATLVIGHSLDRAADLLRKRAGVPDYRFAGLMGLDECDAFLQVLSALSARPVPAFIERQRARLQDAMVDCHFYLGGAPVAIAADSDLLGSLGAFLQECGARVVAAVTPSHTARLATLPFAEVHVGDLEDFERLATKRDAHLLLTNSHGDDIARRLGRPLLRVGFPLYDEVGAYAKTRVCYAGSRLALFEAANLLLRGHREIAPYRSIFWQGGARDREAEAYYAYAKNASPEIAFPV
ncbi:MAG: nitrogenase iron-molybdenum cofactor biosynthesis protein NifN [Zoogloeaceae bacterium]|jgi:nitrogenase molybdenum-iron protein NifN|nr:nitrogenase iron-molybdenum cofactor biosynthesis protein NifN [Zoogloeaceae bacterium]